MYASGLNVTGHNSFDYCFVVVGFSSIYPMSSLSSSSFSFDYVARAIGSDLATLNEHLNCICLSCQSIWLYRKIESKFFTKGESFCFSAQIYWRSVGWSIDRSKTVMIDRFYSGKLIAAHCTVKSQ